ncbi:tyrosine-type recombinase/integrase [Romboutsia sp. CE17]|uniref:tyrosine-type recombinase/integrase n=1 Tax=Romboutsia sp. CE17 TaxID=2724150 RepID=UPI001442C161|nr:tyrosine-type recombinase/integrase [Romboutsia sp. CE17]QJA09168.1 tyrosine-type recombinase/integrase [Romboutsia sp. CE17]
MEVIQEYINYIKNKKKLSDNTVSSYFIDIKKYIEYLYNKNIKLEDVRENDIIAYLIELERSNISAATVSRMISSIKSFHDYLFFSGKCEKDPSRSIKKPKVKQQDIDVLTEDEINALLNFPNLDTPRQIRDKAIFEILYGTGIKVSELIEMNITDFDLDIEYIYCNSGKHQRVIPISDITKFYLEKYLKEGRPKIANEKEESLFVNSLGSRFTRQGLWKVIKKYAVDANINKNINPSMLRHSFAIHLLNNGANVAVVSKILGNSNLSSLQSYVNHINKNIRKEMKEKHPRTK